MRYRGGRTAQISFPLGGIGTGSIGLAGNGRLIDFEIFGRPNKRSLNGFSGFAVKAEGEGKVLDARTLTGPFPPPYTGEREWGKRKHAGYGFGPPSTTLAGMPHFATADFDGAFPLARVDFCDPAFPGTVQMTAFNPLIPLADDDSSLPAAFFDMTVTNTTDRLLTYDLCCFFGNPFAEGLSFNEGKQQGTARGVVLTHRPEAAEQLPPERLGGIAIATDCPQGGVQTYWYRGSWCDELEVFWSDFCSPGPLKDRVYPADLPLSPYAKPDTGCVSARVEVAPGQRRQVRFVTAWYFPNISNFWNPEQDGEPTRWRHHYATRFDDAWAVAAYGLAAYDRLLADTRTFADALHGSTLPPEVLDAVTANLSVLKTPTVLRLEDGTFYGFEGCIADEGCCEGSCTHVWNYAYALPFLFPALERGMREADFRYNQRADGRMCFRLQLPLGRAPWDFSACVDGQFGGVIKTYREWKLSGDDGWLAGIWPAVRRSLEYAWAPTNEDRWDPDRSGVLTGRQHHTLDMELFGANAWLTGFYLAALQAGARMAEHLGEREAATLYRDIFARGKAYVDSRLFNGEYYAQRVDLGDREQLRPHTDRDAYRGYWNEEAGQLKYQIGDGCGIDQVVAGWHAALCGLGDVFDPAQERTALSSLYKYNYKHMADIANTWRNFALGDESGLLICTWPRGGKPVIPLTYHSECMTGFEYQAACHMLMHGLVEEGLTVVRAIRHRYDGERRNPWSEIECGSNYARSMASYSLLLAYAGFTYDLGAGRIGFAPITPWRQEGFRSFFSVGTGWGTVEIGPEGLTLRVLYGVLALRGFDVPPGFVAGQAEAHGQPVGFDQDGGAIAFFAEVRLTAGDAMTLREEKA